MAVPDARIRGIEAVLTVVDGKVVYAAEELAGHGPPPLPVSPSWSPAAGAGAGGVQAGLQRQGHAGGEHVHGHGHDHAHGLLHEAIDHGRRWLDSPFGAGMGCDCFVI